VALPLAGLRIVAVEQYGAGPWATLQLADLGAEVIKIEDPATGGDVARYAPPTYQAGEHSLFFETFNRNKRSVSLDLRLPEGRVVFEDLVRRADVVFSNLRGDQPARLRLTFEDLRAVNPAIVCCALSGFGRTGRRAGEGSYDYMVQGLAGWMSLTGEPDGPPTKTGLSLVDLSAGYVAAIAILAGVLKARRDGVGCDCDISLFETALAELCYLGTWVASRGYRAERTPNSAHPSIVPFQNIAAADGWLVVGCPKQKFWERLCQVIGRSELILDPRFATFAERDRNRDELLAILGDAFRKRSVSEWVDALAAAGIPCAPVNDVVAALEEPQVADRHGLVSYDHPVLGTVTMISTPLRVGDDEKPLARAPFRGEDTVDVLSTICEYDADRLRALAATGVFGTAELDELDVDTSTLRTS